ncbi:hypothetical protein BBJ28_00023860 [Nothophytophthora sp. Chile5]|nr:hypothetical protein BBJ28_00023860 [Nothophytophthora sp. Chile5]
MKSGSPRMKGRTKSTPRGSTGLSLFDSSCSLGYQQVERISIDDSVPQSFQEQVLQELQKLKEAQRLEFEALERLQREKDEAERKARRLELKVREQQRQLRQKGRLQPQRARSPAVVHPIKGRHHETSPHEDVDLELEAESQSYASNNHSDNGDACEKEDDGTEDEAEEIEWDDSKSPPPYFDADTLASPAVSLSIAVVQ